LPTLLPTEAERQEVVQLLRRFAAELGELGARREPQLREIESLLGVGAPGGDEKAAAQGSLRAIS
jgi:hypothetical protein